MPKYIVAYYGGPKFETPGQGKAYMAKWRAWMDGLGEALVDPGTPLPEASRIAEQTSSRAFRF
jgi:hypothetical protein